MAVGRALPARRLERHASGSRLTEERSVFAKRVGSHTDQIRLAGALHVGRVEQHLPLPLQAVGARPEGRGLGSTQDAAGGIERRGRRHDQDVIDPGPGPDL